MMILAKLFFSSCIIISAVLGFQLDSLSSSRVQHAQPLWYRGGALAPAKAVTRFSSQPSPVASALLATTSASSSDSTSSSSLIKEWTPKRMHNTNWFRSGVILLVVGLMGFSQSSPIARLSKQAGAALHLLSFSTWFGTMVYTTFILGITAFRNLPRQTFGKLQSKLFPKYFTLGSICLVLQVSKLGSNYECQLQISMDERTTSCSQFVCSSSSVLHQILTLRSLSLSFLGDKRVTWSLGSALVATLVNIFFMEPYTTKIMLKRYDLENAEGGTDTDRYKELKKVFGKMHGLSSLTNLMALCGTVAYGLVLASLLVATA